MDKLRKRISELSKDKQDLLKKIISENKKHKLEYTPVFEEEYSLLTPVKEKEFYPASSAQKRIFLVEEIGKNLTTYNMPVAVMICGILDKNRLESSFQKIVNRHESLRTYFTLNNGELVQIIVPDIGFNLEYEECEEKIISKYLKKFIRPFNLKQAPLLRAKLLKISDTKHALIIDMHHIISDGYSLNIFINEITLLYNQKELSPVSFQYKDFAYWQNNLKNNRKVKIYEKYWKELLKDEIPVLNLPLDFQRPKVQSFAGDSFHLMVKKDLTEKLRKLAVKNDVTLYMIFLASVYVLFYKYSGQKDIVIGTPVAGRNHADLHDIFGMFVNTLPLRLFLETDKTFKIFLEEVKMRVLTALENQQYQFEELIEQLNIRRDIRRNPIFDVMFGFQNLENNEINLEGLSASFIELEHKTSRFDLTISAIEESDNISLGFEFCTKLFLKDSIKRMGCHLINILKEICENSDAKLHEIKMLSQSETEQIISEFNSTQKDYNYNRLIHEIFTEQAIKTPNNVALVSDDKKLTYDELDKHSNQLAQVICKNGPVKGRMIAVMAEPCFEMFIGIFAVLKAGAGFLPVEPGLPDKRIEYMLSDSNVSMILVQPHLNHTGNDKITRIVLDKSVWDCEKTENPGISIQPKDIAYNIYTSGSTGLPKAVMIEHRSLVNFCMWYNINLKVTESDRATKYASFSFDASILEIFPCLAAGASVYICNQADKIDLRKLNKSFEENKVTISFLPTAICEEFIKLNNDYLRILNTGGDCLRVFKKQNYQLINNYGPAENTVITTCFPVDKEYENIPIGKPVFNSRVFIVNNDFQLQPVGVWGEICIDGIGLSKGYFNKPELTKQKFITPDTEWSRQAGITRIYRTGDIGRWLPDGNIEFSGRADRQVKIRGCRIELGEIENRLNKNNLVKTAAVIAKEDKSGNKYLCAYYVAEGEIEPEELRTYLSEDLPWYMIPAHIIQIENMLVTSNGKLDISALPEPSEITDSRVVYEAPADETEKKLANAWQEILGLDNVGINDNFFQIGGDSIKALQISSKLYEEGLELNVKDIFQYPVIKLLKNHCRNIRKTVPQDNIEGEIPLTSIQKWFFNLKLSVFNHFNQSVMLYNKQGFNKDFIKIVFKKLIEHHDSLRITFKMKENKIIQFNNGVNAELFTLKVYDLHGDKQYENTISKAVNKLQSEINLDAGPLVKLGLFKTQEGDHLVIIIHHLVIDGISWRILLEDLSSLYEQMINRKPLKLPLKTDSFMSWSEKLREYAHSNVLLNEITYWRKIEKTDILSLCKKGNDLKNSNVNTVNISFSEAKTKMLINDANRVYNTNLVDLLLTSLGITLRGLFGADRILVNLEGHGREEIADDINISRTVGWFTSIFPVILDMSFTDDLSYQIRLIKETLRCIPNNGMGYSILKYITPEKYLEGMKFSIKPEITFNYLGRIDSGNASEYFELSKLSTGNNISPENKSDTLLEINCLLMSNRLEMSITYQKQEITNEEMHKLMNSYKENLDLIISHCVNCAGNNDGKITPSDLGNKDINGIDIEDLDEIIKKVDNI